jgi:hypothetical protein
MNLGRMKELLEQQYYDEAAEEIAIAKAESEQTRAAEAEARLILEREWGTRHPAEWAEWVRILPLLAFSYDFETGETYDFPQFLSDVGSHTSRPPSPGWYPSPTRHAPRLQLYHATPRSVPSSRTSMPAAPATAPSAKRLQRRSRRPRRLPSVCPPAAEQLVQPPAHAESRVMTRRCVGRVWRSARRN